MRSILRTRLFLAGAVVLVFAGSYVAKGLLAQASRQQLRPAADVRRLLGVNGPGTVDEQRNGAFHRVAQSEAYGDAHVL